MTPCDPIDLTNIHVPTSSTAGLVPTIPTFSLPDPLLGLEDLSDIFNRLTSILPFGTVLHPHLSFGPDRNIFDGIKDLLRFINIFLIPLKFIIPILQMILCIIEVLCSLLNPFKLARALRRLFRICIPAILSLFPAAALILLIIALLLLIIELIIYLIQRIIALIEQIIKNIKILSDSIQSFDNDSVIAIVQKIGDLLCSLQNFFVIFGVIALIIEVIQQLLNLFFRLPPCSKGSTDGCCDALTCPSFIGDNKEIISLNGNFLYFNKVIETNEIVQNKTLRETSYQFWDSNQIEKLRFNNITHAFDLPKGTKKVFFPSGTTYDSSSNPDQVPYTVDIRFFYDPALFGRTDSKGARWIRILNCIVTKPPVDYVKTYNNGKTSPNTGTLSITGGAAYEDDATTYMKVNSDDENPGTIETIVILPDTIQESSTISNTGFVYYPTEYTFKINHDILIAQNLISLGCHPDVAFDIAFINDGIVRQTNSVSTSLQTDLTLPNISNTQDCLFQAIDKFRSNVSVETAAELQTELLACLSNLQDETKSSLNQVIGIAFDPYKSSFTIDPTIQFTTLPIEVSVSLNEQSGSNMATNLPTDVADTLSKKLKGFVTLGQISDFTYDGSSVFKAQITSEVSGNGNVSVSFDNKYISTLTNPEDIDQTPTIEIKELLYTFVHSDTLNIEKVVRDEGDVARE